MSPSLCTETLDEARSSSRRSRQAVDLGEGAARRDLQRRCRRPGPRRCRRRSGAAPACRRRRSRARPHARRSPCARRSGRCRPRRRRRPWQWPCRPRGAARRSASPSRPRRRPADFTESGAPALGARLSAVFSEVPTETILLFEIVQPGSDLPVGCQLAPLASGVLWVMLPLIVTPVASWFTRITGVPERRRRPAGRCCW